MSMSLEKMYCNMHLHGNKLKFTKVLGAVKVWGPWHMPPLPLC